MGRRSGRSHLFKNQLVEKKKQTVRKDAVWVLRVVKTKHTLRVYQHGRIHLDNHFGRGGREDLAMYRLGETEECPCFEVRRWLARQLREVTATGSPVKSTFEAMLKGGIAKDSHDVLTSLYAVQAEMRERLNENKFKPEHHQVKQRGADPVKPVNKKEQYLKFMGREKKDPYASTYKDGVSWGETLPVFLLKGQARKDWPLEIHPRLESIRTAVARFLSPWGLHLASSPGEPAALIDMSLSIWPSLRRAPLGVEAMRYGLIVFQRTLTYSYRWETEAGDGKVAILQGFFASEMGVLSARELVVEAWAGERPKLLLTTPLPQLPGQTYYGWDLIERKPVTMEEAKIINTTRIP